MKVGDGEAHWNDALFVRAPKPTPPRQEDQTPLTVNHLILMRDGRMADLACAPTRGDIERDRADREAEAERERAERYKDVWMPSAPAEQFMEWDPC